MNRVARSLAGNPVTIFLIILGIVFLVAARSLPAPRFDPLGAGAFPTALGWLMVVLGVADLARTAWISWRHPAPPIGARGGVKGTLQAGYVLLLTVLYGFSMAVFELNFALATAVYLMAASFAFGHVTLRGFMLRLILFSAFALALGYLLKSVVYVDLP
jgi:hypothetical protein